MLARLECGRVSVGSAPRASAAVDSLQAEASRAGGRRSLRRAVQGLAACLTLSSTAVFSDEELQKAGDVLQFAIPFAGLGATYWYDDEEGRRQLWKSAGANILTVNLMKASVRKLRPNFGAETSYPSGHTNGAFIGATFLNTRYGPYWGVPAYALAALTGYSRVHADAHFADDVVAGASIAMLYNWAFVTPISKNVALGPMRVANGYGLGLTVSDAGPNGSTAPVHTGPTRFRFEYMFTPAYLRTNRVRAPGGTGTEFDLDSFDKVADPTSATVSEFEWKLDERHAIAIQITLFESRDVGRFSQSTSFGGKTFPAGATVASAYRSYSLPLIYRYDLAPNSRWIARVGATLVPVATSVEISDGTEVTEVSESGVALLPNVMIGARLSDDLRITADTAGRSSGNEEMFEAGVRLTYALSRQWEAGFGYRRYAFRQDSDKLFNDVEYDAWQAGVAYLW